MFAYGPAGATAIPKPHHVVLPVWYRLTQVVPEKRLLNGCVCSVAFWLKIWALLRGALDLQNVGRAAFDIMQCLVLDISRHGG